MKTPTITYRKASLADVEILAAYRVQFLNEVAQDFSNPKAEQLKAELIAYFREKIANNTIVNWLAVDQDQIVATSCMTIWDMPLGYGSIGTKGRRGYILNMYTLEAYRKKGIAAQLLDKLLAEARALQLEHVHLHATSDGIRLYQKLGFQAPTYPELKLKIY